MLLVLMRGKLLDQVIIDTTGAVPAIPANIQVREWSGQ